MERCSRILIARSAKKIRGGWWILDNIPEIYSLFLLYLAAAASKEGYIKGFLVRALGLSFSASAMVSTVFPLVSGPTVS